MKIIRDVIREYTVFISCLFLVAAAWLHQIQEACFSFILHLGMFLEGDNLTELCEIIGTSAICGFLLFLFLLLMTNFQYCYNVLDSGMFRCLSVLTHPVCMAPWRPNSQELHQTEQFVMCFWEWQVCIAHRVRGGMFLALINTPNSPANWHYANELNVRWGAGGFCCQGLKWFASISSSCEDAAWHAADLVGINKPSFANGWELSANKAVSQVKAKRIGPSIDWRETCLLLRLCIIYTFCSRQLSWMSHCFDRMASTVVDKAWSWIENRLWSSQTANIWQTCRLEYCFLSSIYLFSIYPVRKAPLLLMPAKTK